MHRRDVPKALLATAAGAALLSRQAQAQTSSFAPFFDVRQYGASPSASAATNATAIQNAIDAASSGGGIVFIPSGTFQIAATLILRPNVTILGAGCGDSSTIGSVGRATVLQPTAAFSGAEVIRADAADVPGSDPYCRGVGLANFMIDMIYVRLASRCAINIRSVSDAAVFENLRVWNQDTGQALYVGLSAKPGALLSDGLIFSNLVVLSYGIDAFSGAMVVLEDCNEIAFRDGKIMARSNGNPVPGSIGVNVKCTSIGCSAITFDGVSFAGFESGVRTSVSGGGTGPRWVRALNTTHEVYKWGYYLDGAAAPLAAQFCVIGTGCRFITPVAGGSNIVLDHASNCTVIADELSFTGSIARLTANSTGNLVIAPPSQVTDSGINNVILGRKAGALEVSALFGQELQVPMLLSGWSQFSATNRSALGYWKGPDGIVHVQGHATGGPIGQPLMQLPAGYRPLRTKNFAVASNGAAGVCRIDESGFVWPDAGSPSWFSLDGISFRIGD
jgi:hypothetical protein